VAALTGQKYGDRSGEFGSAQFAKRLHPMEYMKEFRYPLGGPASRATTIVKSPADRHA
jgi:hypothetical protein